MPLREKLLHREHMRINIENFFRHIYDLDGVSGKKSNQFVLSELVGNMKQFRDRIKKGDAEVAKEFFKLYVFDDNQ